MQRLFRLASSAFFVALLAVFARASQEVIDNYLGLKGSVPRTALGARATFVDRALEPLAEPGPNDVVLWQNPLPGESFPSTARARFLVSDKVPVPEVVGMRVQDAETLLAYRGLMLSVAAACGDAGRASQEDEQDQQVNEQCVAPGTLVDAGTYIGVVIEPWPESALLWVAVGLAVTAALLALAFFTRLKFTQRELAVFKSGSPK